MEDGSNDLDYEVGYRRPPKDYRFKKGESGNPKGRPRGSLNLATVLEKTLREKVVVNEGGRRKAITKLQAAVKQLVNRAAGGDLSAFRQLRELVRSAEDSFARKPEGTTAISAADEKVLESVLKRFESSLGDGERSK